MITTALVIVAVLIRIVANPFANVFQKKLTENGNHPLAVNFLTYFILSLACLPFAFSINWQQLPFQFWAYAAVSGLIGAAGNGFLVKALQSGDLSVLGPINAYKSVVGLITGIFIIGELPNLYGLIGVALIIYGSYFVLDTTAERFTWQLLKQKAIQYRIYALVLTGIEAVLTKKIIQTSNTTITFLSWCWFGALFSFLLFVTAGLPITKERISLSIKNRIVRFYLALFVCVAAMQITTNYAFAHIPVGYALSLFQLSTIISVLLGHRLFAEKEIRKKLIGAFIMIVGSILIILLQHA